MQKLLEKISELWGWLVIVMAFTGLGVGGTFIIIYLIIGVAGKIIGSIIGLTFICIGILIANKAYKGKGTVFALSKTMATPGLDGDSDLSQDTSSTNTTKSL